MNKLVRDKILDAMSHVDSDEAKLDAALKVMREPDEAMIREGAKNNIANNPKPCGPECTSSFFISPRKAFKAMLTTLQATKEGE